MRTLYLSRGLTKNKYLLKTSTEKYFLQQHKLNKLLRKTTYLKQFSVVNY